MALQSTRTPAPGVIKFTILVSHALFIITLYLICLPMPISEEDDF